MNYWVWTTKSEYFLEDAKKSNVERKLLDPKHNRRPDAWWSCAKGTRAGDLILVYRAGAANGRTYKDLAYLLLAESNAYPLSQEDVFDWPYGCSYRPCVKLNAPLTLSEMKDDELLSNWGPIKAGFNGRARGVPDEMWDHLVEVINSRNPGFSKQVRAFRAGGQKIAHASEKSIEDALANDLGRLKAHGYDVRLHAETDPPRFGQQYYCKSDGTRIDLLCRYKSRRKKFLVIEVKNVAATPSHVGQIANYMDWVHDELGGTVRGLLVTQGRTSAYENGRRSMPRGIEQIDVADLGI